MSVPSDIPDPTQPLSPPPRPGVTRISLSDQTDLWGDPIPPPPVAGYEILDELARGGMGVVYLARQVHLNRTVALKMLVGDAHADPRWLVRFLAEAEAVAAIDHPHVVRVIEFGETNGRPFLVMEYLPGGTLADRILQGGRRKAEGGGAASSILSPFPAPPSPFPPREAAELVEKLARAVAAAHDAGIIHRDLKPANVLFDAAGEPKVADFGLAKRCRGAELTVTGETLGTPSYMAPEQVGGEGTKQSLATDVWALGVILYECLTGEKPFPGADPYSIFRRVVEDNPPAIRTFAPGVPRDLEHICRQCLEKNPADRYPTAEALAADLRRFLNGEPVSVRPPGAPERLAKWARRKPTAAAAWGFGLLAAGLTLAGGTAAGLWQRAEVARSEAEESNQRLSAAQQTLQGANRNLIAAEEAIRKLRSFAAVDLAHREYMANTFPRARRLLDEVPADLRQWEWGYVDRLLTAEHRVYRGHKGAVLGVAALPDSRTVVSAGANGQVRVWDLPTLTDKAALSLGSESAVRAVAVSPDGTRAAAGGDDRTVTVWDTATWAVRQRVRGFAQPVAALAFLPDSRRLAVGTAELVPNFDHQTTGPGEAGVWDTDTGGRRAAFTLPDPHHGARGLAVSRDGRRVAVAGGVRSVSVFDPDTGRQLAALVGGDSVSLCVGFGEGDHTLFAGNADYTSQRWDLATAEGVSTREVHTGAIDALAVSPDGHKLTTGAGDRTLRVWRTSQTTDLYAIRGPAGPVRAVANTPDGRFVLAASDDGTVRAWPADHGPEWVKLAHPRNVRGVAVSADGTRVLTACEDGAVREWHPLTRQVRDIPAHAGIVYGVALSADGRRAATVGGDGLAVVWELPRWTRRQVIRGHVAEMTAVAWAPDPKLVLTGSNDHTARLWEADTGRTVQTFVGHTGPVLGVVATPDWKYVLTASHDGTARVWDRATGAVVHTLAANPGPVLAVAVSGGVAVTGHMDGTAILWDIATGRRRGELLGHHGQVGAVGFSADGHRIFTGGADRLLKVWDAATGQQVLSVKGHVGYVIGVAASADGSTVVTGCGDESANVWYGGR